MTQRKEHFMKPIQSLILVTVVAVFAGCATVPKELIDARSAYEHASAGLAAQLAPAELHKAHEALGLAEQSFEKDHDSYKARDLAYVAQRKSELAEALAAMAADKASKAQADADFQRKQTEIVKQGKQDLSDSEKRTADALAELAKLAAVKEGERGLVVTLSGSVLFRSGESNLLPSAQVKLDQVANALLAVRVRNLIVEGHTDSQEGSESYNQGLSQRRADAVRDYLVQRGYPADCIQARGKGEGSPIANNASPEGRANNRRVEIIIERESHTSNQ
jgi:outer membrane protein OmpA-like peptidoglycan-associated protein